MVQSLPKHLARFLNSVTTTSFDGINIMDEFGRWDDGLRNLINIGIDNHHNHLLSQSCCSHHCFGQTRVDFAFQCSRSLVIQWPMTTDFYWCFCHLRDILIFRASTIRCRWWGWRYWWHFLTQSWKQISIQLATKTSRNGLFWRCRNRPFRTEVGVGFQIPPKYAKVGEEPWWNTHIKTYALC